MGEGDFEAFANTSSSGYEGGYQDHRQPVDTQEFIWLVSLIMLPYISYAGLLVLFGLIMKAMSQRGQQVWQLCAQRGFGWLTVGLLLSSSFALNRGESFLQLANFLPFFLFFGVLATVPSVVQQPFIKLEALARWLLLTSAPISVLAVVEFGLKFDAVALWMQVQPLPHGLLSWIYEPDFGHRAHSLLGHPNTLSAYLVIILGLGLGLLLKGLSAEKRGLAAIAPIPSPVLSEARARARSQQITQVAALGLCAIAIFCSGSRNGVLIALVMVAIALYAARRHRWVMLAGLAGSGAIVAAVLSLGIGGRSLSLALLTQDPRIAIWHLALEMIWQRPIQGWGFAGLRLLYEPGSIPDYDVVFHAHNIWLFLASEAGIPVVIGFCLVIGTIYYRGICAFVYWNRQGWNSDGTRAILLGYLLAFSSCLMFGLFDVTLFDARINIFSWGLLAAIYLMSHAYTAENMQKKEHP
jgi:O-antigen ligase